MIRAECEYEDARRRLGDEALRLEAERDRLATEEGLSAEEVERAIMPARSFHEQLREEVAAYERLRRGDFSDFRPFECIGTLLVALRVHADLSQRELAARLGVHESQVSRDERNEYRGATKERMGRVLEALGVRLETTVRELQPAAAGPEREGPAD